MEEFAVTGWSLFWFAVPIPALVIWAVITFFTERRDEDA